MGHPGQMGPVASVAVVPCGVLRGRGAGEGHGHPPSSRSPRPINDSPPLYIFYTVKTLPPLPPLSLSVSLCLCVKTSRRLFPFSTANTVRGRGWVSVEKGVVSVEFSWVSVESNCAFYTECDSFLQFIAFFRKNSTETLRFRVLKKGVNAFIFAQTQ